MSYIDTKLTQNNYKDENLDRGRFTNKQFEITSFDNNSNYDYTSIFRGIAMIQTFFGETPNEDDYLDNALECLRQIGNLHISLYGYVGKTDDKGELCLPVSAMSIEYVTDGAEDFFTWSVRSEVSQLHPPGRSIDYKFLGDKIVTDFIEKDISVAYRTFKNDEEGLPMITQKEANACAYWWKWVDTRRKMYQGNQLAASVLQLAERDKNKAINQARVPEAYSQNFMDKMLDIIYSRDRKIYNRMYKPVKV
jgi:hypothetical protein